MCYVFIITGTKILQFWEFTFIFHILTILLAAGFQFRKFVDIKMRIPRLTIIMRLFLYMKGTKKTIISALSWFVSKIILKYKYFVSHNKNKFSHKKNYLKYRNMHISHLSFIINKRNYHTICLQKKLGDVIFLRVTKDDRM